jgi:hypothetical protein
MLGFFGHCDQAAVGCRERNFLTWISTEIAAQFSFLARECSTSRLRL